MKNLENVSNNKRSIFLNLLFLLLTVGSFFILEKAHANNQRSVSQETSPIVMGYYSEWAIYSPNIHIQDLPAQFMTHLVYKSAFLTENGDIEPGDAFADIEHLYATVNIEEESILGNFGQLINLKKRHTQLKSIISIGGWARSENFALVASTAQGRENIARSAIDFMQKYQFNGIEIDWQFPIGYSPNPAKQAQLSQPNDPLHLSLLMQELNRQCALLSQRCWLQVVLAPYSLVPQWSAQQLNDHVDVVVLDVSRIHGDKSVVTEHQSPLYSPAGERSIDGLINTLNQYGVDKQKIIMAIPSFAVGWDGVADINNGLKQVPKGFSWGSWDSKASGETGIYNQKNLFYFIDSLSYEYFWDDASKASYLYNPLKFKGHFISFESEQSIEAKVRYAEQENLAGIAVRQLHNGDNVLKATFYNFYFFKAIYYKAQEFWQINKSILIAVLQLLAFIFLAFFAFIIYSNNRNREQYNDRKQFLKLQNDLQNLEWPLLNVMAISPILSSKNLADDNTIKQLIQGSSQLLQPINAVLSSTTLNSTMSSSSKELINLQEIFITVNCLISVNKQCKLIWQDNINRQLLVNTVHFQQFIYNICHFCLESEHSCDELTVSCIDKNHNVELFITANSAKLSSSINHAQLKSLFRQANTLGYQLKLLSKEQFGFEILIPQNKSELAYQFTPQFLFSNTPNSALSALLTNKNVPEIKTESSNQFKNKNKNENENLNINDIGLNETLALKDNSDHLFDEIASFNLTNLPSKDIFKGLEQACQFFLNYLDKDSKIIINQHGQLVSKIGEVSASAQFEKVINANDFTIEISTSKALSSENEQLIQVLVSQTLMVHKAIKSLVQEPSMLAELYEITRYKERIKYLKAESGYTGIYLKSKKDPRFITMRLRTVRLYFDESFLLQIHRSYLINPKKVSHVDEVSKLKYQLIIDDEKLPISRTYVPALKELYPHWFAN